MLVAHGRIRQSPWDSHRTEDGHHVFKTVMLATQEDIVTISGNKDKVCWWHMEDGKVLGVHDATVLALPYPTRLG